MTYPEIIECLQCGRMFADTDGTRVCPRGHENPWVDDETDPDHIPARKVTG